MKALHLGSFNELLKTFGYDKTKIIQEVERCLGRKLLKPKQEQQVQQQPIAQKLPQPEFKPMTAESAADFFSELGSRSNNAPPGQSKGNQNNNNVEDLKVEEEPSQTKLQMVTETISRNTNWDEGIEGIIKRNLLIGNLEYAADVALKAGRTTEALLIADAGGE